MKKYVFKKSRMFSYLSGVGLGFGLAVNSLYIGVIALALGFVFDYISCITEN